jgi:uncharacterized protein YndB with AHSA1/START domain
MKSPDSVSVSTVVAVDPLTAFSMFTEEIALWWKPKLSHLLRGSRAGTMKFEPGPQGRLLEVFDDEPDAACEIGRVRHWVPGKRLVFEWRAHDFGPENLTEVEVVFDAVGKGTRVTIEHRGWASLPPASPARHGLTGEAFTNMIGLRWAELLALFKVSALHRKNPNHEP